MLAGQNTLDWAGPPVHKGNITAPQLRPIPMPGFSLTPTADSLTAVSHFRGSLHKHAGFLSAFIGVHRRLFLLFRVRTRGVRFVRSVGLDPEITNWDVQPRGVNVADSLEALKLGQFGLATNPRSPWRHPWRHLYPWSRVKRWRVAPELTVFHKCARRIQMGPLRYWVSGPLAGRPAPSTILAVRPPRSEGRIR